MTSQLRNVQTAVLTAVVLLILLPPAVFLAAALYRGMGLSGGLAALLEQYTAERTNLAVITILGLFPLLVIGLLLVLRRLVRKTWADAALYFVGGTVPVLLIAVFVHLEYWPSYLPSRSFLGFPHGLEFVIGPLFFAPAGAALGMLVTWLVRRNA